jgi:hypothetical protein
MRRDRTVTIPHVKQGERENRDSGKVYVITEMAASLAEDWAVRAWMALSKSGVEVPAGIASLGMVGVALITFQAFRYAHFSDVKPLMDEMMACVKVAPTPGNYSVTRALVESDIEEVKTRIDLKREVLELHTGFTMAELASMAASSAKDQMPSHTQTSQG